MTNIILRYIIDISKIFDMKGVTMKMQKNLLKILIPAIMLIVIVVIWFTQNTGEDAAAVSGEITPGFELNVNEVDLESWQQHNLPIIIDFGATECEPCKAMAPVLVDLNAEMQEKAIIKFVDVWVNPAASQDYPVQVIPTQILINADGTPYVPSEEVAQQIQFSAYADRESGEHVFTAHMGGLSEEQMRLILTDMGVEG